MHSAAASRSQQCPDCAHDVVVSHVVVRLFFPFAGNVLVRLRVGSLPAKAQDHVIFALVAGLLVRLFPGLDLEFGRELGGLLELVAGLVRSYWLRKQ